MKVSWGVENITADVEVSSELDSDYENDKKEKEDYG